MEELRILAGFASYVILHPRRKGQKSNSVSHAERAIAAVGGYYRSIDGMIAGKDALVDFGDYIKGILKGLGKLYPTIPQRSVPLLVDDMRAIRAVMNLGSYSEAEIWALWISQWQGFMRGSDIFRLTDQRERKWDPDSDMHLDRITWEKVEPEKNHGCTLKMRWTLKPTKTDQAGTKGFVGLQAWIAVCGPRQTTYTCPSWGDKHRTE